MSERCDVVVIGAGVCGLTAARQLAQTGSRVVVLEKSRGVSGRAATRRWADCVVDHGAQFFTARSRKFTAQVQSWLERGICFHWADGFRNDSGHPRYACAAGMSALGKDLAAELDVRREMRVNALHRAGASWKVQSGELEIFAPQVLLTMPVPQVLELLPPARWSVSNQLHFAAMTSIPALCVVVKFAAPAPSWKGMQLSDDDVLSWIGHDSSKRPNPRGDVVLVLHAGEEFSRTWQDQDMEHAADVMMTRAAELTGLDFSHGERLIHRWRYSRMRSAAAIGKWMVDEGLPGLMITGDAFAGSTIEGAWLAGSESAAELFALRLGR